MKTYLYIAMSDALVNGLAGAGGGIIAQVLTYPLQAVSVKELVEHIISISFHSLAFMSHHFI